MPRRAHPKDTCNDIGRTQCTRAPARMSPAHVHVPIRVHLWVRVFAAHASLACMHLLCACVLCASIRWAVRVSYVRLSLGRAHLLLHACITLCAPFST